MVRQWKERNMIGLIMIMIVIVVVVVVVVVD